MVNETAVMVQLAVYFSKFMALTTNTFGTYDWFLLFLQKGPNCIKKIVLDNVLILKVLAYPAKKFYTLFEDL